MERTRALRLIFRRPRELLPWLGMPFERMVCPRCGNSQNKRKLLVEYNRSVLPHLMFLLAAQTVDFTLTHLRFLDANCRRVSTISRQSFQKVYLESVLTQSHSLSWMNAFLNLKFQDEEDIILAQAMCPFTAVFTGTSWGDRAGVELIFFCYRIA